jgi:hypothetical protein
MVDSTRLSPGPERWPGFPKRRFLSGHKIVSSSGELERLQHPADTLPNLDLGEVEFMGDSSTVRTPADQTLDI